MPERNIETSLFVRFAPKADKRADITLSPLRANCRHRPTHGGCTMFALVPRQRKEPAFADHRTSSSSLGCQALVKNGSSGL